MAQIAVTSPTETLEFRYDVNSTGDGSYTGTAQDAGLTMYIYSAASVQYGDASTKTDINLDGHAEIKGNLVVTVTNNSDTATTEPIYFTVTTTTGGSVFTNNINDTQTLLVTSTSDGILAPSATGTATIQVTHTGTSIDDTATFTINLFEGWDSAYETLTPTVSGTVQVSVSAALLNLTTVVNGKTAATDGAYYIKSGDTFNYDITITNTGNVATTAADTRLTIVTDETNLTLGSVKGYTDSGFTTGEVDLVFADGKYTIPVSIPATNGAYYVRVSETAK